ncbi:lipase maturation factor 1 [Eptesicus fuscus]|uniref:lipase maturation factor 1 n=1 Tax=Eptesicus fuscus TaxID=29078 RepID=UPI002403A900|nr:lipase maturation factor 1 [Eptesicus fuscus]
MAAPGEQLRRRKAADAGQEPASPPGPGHDPAGCPARLRAGTFWLTRIVLLRALAFIYFVAFLVAFHQNKQLIGDRGLLPCRVYLKSVQQYFQGQVGWGAVSYAPTLLWLLDWSHMDSNLDALALLGLRSGSSTCPWSTWDRSGWESQLLETGFLGIFLCPLWTLSRLPRKTPTSRIVVWGFRWLIFRIMLGAGLIKIRGDQCWRDLTCMDFHYETQPVPNPMAYFLHHSPWWVHRFETLSNHFLELVVPFFIFLGRRMCILHGALQILFQVVLIVSGNLSFLNWLTIVPSIACFDDATMGFLFPSGPGSLKDQVLKMQKEEAREARPTPTYGCMVRQAANLALGVLVAWLSIPVVLNLLSPKQVMNSSFNPLRIVNTYGAFGSITRERTEVILQGTASPNASAPDTVWEDYEFKCKPGDLRRRPCLISPYHHRLDWLMWFAAFQTYEQHEWVIHLAGRLLANDAEVLSLLALNPFADRDPPRWVRGEHYRYKFSRPGGLHAADGKWWIRKRIGPYFPPLSLQNLKGYFRSREWPYPAPE